MTGNYADCDRAESLFRQAVRQGIGGLPLGEIVVWVGRQFLGAPYQAAPLECMGPERVVVDLQAFDCVTFLETCLGLALLIEQGQGTFADLPRLLTRIRYRHGRCNGYGSRLHYFTDWLFDAGRKGLVEDLTPALGGLPYEKGFCALTDRRADLPALAGPATFRRLRIVEACCAKRPLSFLPKADWDAWSGKLQDGDLIAVTTDRPGIDVIHVGIAWRVAGGLKLLHASSVQGKVMANEGTLEAYLADKAERTGVIVGRPRAPRRRA